jgi:hypothetical protein
MRSDPSKTDDLTLGGWRAQGHSDLRHSSLVGGFDRRDEPGQRIGTGSLNGYPDIGRVKE